MWHFLYGYVIIEAQGLSAARFLKRLTDHGIRVSNVMRIDEATMLLTIPARRFFDLRKLRKGLSLRIRIVQRGGFPFLAKKFYRRPFLWVGSVLLFAALCVLSSRIWVIRIEDTKLVDPEEITALLAENGIYPGARLSGPVLITGANDLSARIHDAAWIGLDREGVLLKVSVAEAIPESPKKTTRIPSDVIAEKDGVVTAISVMRGQARVKVGDRVKKGDVLISGTVVRNDKSYVTNADGTVLAAVTYTAEADFFDSVTEAAESGASETVLTLLFGSAELAYGQPSFEHYRLCGSELVSLSDLLPVSIRRSTAYEIVFRDHMLSEEEAGQYALSNARECALRLVPKNAEILNIYGTIRSRNGARIAVVTVTAEETIGRTEEQHNDR